MAWIWVAMGGALGALGRYGVGLVLPRAPFPLATLAVNVVGCLAIGWYLVWSTRGIAAGTLAEARAADLRLFFVVGLLGAFTTFSAFGHETVTLLREGALGAACASIALNLGLGLGAVLLGARIAG